ncbi:MAG: nucleotidyltransferase family protein [Actinobacteria bacterium]|nr:nucleotidyltransferase family protein [Actinomycetota bacterium]MBM3712869.1 nucleotidyltransferase family protein [Actinomycetota bacterium]
MFEKLLTKIAKELEKNSVKYMIIGGQAVLLYGEPRLTRDIDITLGVSIEEVDRILKIIKEIDLMPIPEDIKSFAVKTFVIPVKDNDSGIRIDFIFSQTSYEKQALKRTNTVKINKTALKFASIEDLIIHKIFAGRPRDLEDIKSVMLKNPVFNKDYIIKWLKEFDISLGEAKFVNIFKDILKK